jgi:hypothetical protein
MLWEQTIEGRTFTFHIIFTKNSQDSASCVKHSLTEPVKLTAKITIMGMRNVNQNAISILENVRDSIDAGNLETAIMWLHNLNDRKAREWEAKLRARQYAVENAYEIYGEDNPTFTRLEKEYTAAGDQKLRGLCSCLAVTAVGGALGLGALCLAPSLLPGVIAPVDSRSTATPAAEQLSSAPEPQQVIPPLTPTSVPPTQTVGINDIVSANATALPAP